MKPIAVTGLGPITSIGVGSMHFLQGLRSNSCGIETMNWEGDQIHGIRVGSPVEIDMSQWFTKRELMYLNRFSQFAVIAARLALEDAKLAPQPQFGVMVGCGIGGIGETIDESWRSWNSPEARYHPTHIPRTIINMAAAQISIHLGLHGPCTTAVSACASSTDAIVMAAQSIALGEADVVLAGGTEAALSAFGVGNFDAMRALSRNTDAETASQPLGGARDGFVMGEGAGILILEDMQHAIQRNAKIYCVLDGYGRASEGYHIVKPHPNGIGAQQAMEKAIMTSGVAKSSIDYINLHGTSTLLNDEVEINAVARLFGSNQKVFCSSTKSQIGHTLGAAGAIETIAVCLAIHNGFIPPNMTRKIIDGIPENLCINRISHEQEVRHALKNSLAFGGHCVSLLLSKY